MLEVAKDGRGEVDTLLLLPSGLGDWDARDVLAVRPVVAVAVASDAAAAERADVDCWFTN